MLVSDCMLQMPRNAVEARQSPALWILDMPTKNLGKIRCGNAGSPSHCTRCLLNRAVKRRFEVCAVRRRTISNAQIWETCDAWHVCIHRHKQPTDVYTNLQNNLLSYPTRPKVLTDGKCSMLNSGNRNAWLSAGVYVNTDSAIPLMVGLSAEPLLDQRNLGFRKLLCGGMNIIR